MNTSPTYGERLLRDGQRQVKFQGFVSNSAAPLEMRESGFIPRCTDGTSLFGDLQPVVEPFRRRFHRLTRDALTAVLLGESEIPDLPLGPPRDPVQFLSAVPITQTEGA